MPPHRASRGRAREPARQLESAVPTLGRLRRPRMTTSTPKRARVSPLPPPPRPRSAGAPSTAAAQRANTCAITPAAAPTRRSIPARPEKTPSAASCQSFPGRYRPRLAAKTIRIAETTGTCTPASSLAIRPQRIADVPSESRRMRVANARIGSDTLGSASSRLNASSRRAPTEVTVIQVTATVRKERRIHLPHFRQVAPIVIGLPFVPHPPGFRWGAGGGSRQRLQQGEGRTRC